GALRMADGSAVDWVNDPERAEALYDIDREVTGAIYAPSRVLQHLNSVAELLGDRSGPAAAQGINARRRVNARRARRLVLEQPAVYYSDVGEEVVRHLRSARPAADLERPTRTGAGWPACWPGRRGRLRTTSRSGSPRAGSRSRGLKTAAWSPNPGA